MKIGGCVCFLDLWEWFAFTRRHKDDDASCLGNVQHQAPTPFDTVFETRLGLGLYACRLSIQRDLALIRPLFADKQLSTCEPKPKQRTKGPRFGRTKGQLEVCIGSILTAKAVIAI